MYLGDNFVYKEGSRGFYPFRDEADVVLSTNS